MVDYDWDFAAVLAYWPLLLKGLGLTVGISVVAILIGMAAGGLVAFLRLSRSRVLRLVGTVYVEFYRNTPGIVHFFWFYYALPVLVSIRLGPFEAAVLALS